MHSPFRYVPGVTVTYRPPTSTQGSRWAAVIKRGRSAGDRFRASVSYQQGPDAAARAAVDRFNAATGSEWQVLGAALSVDGGCSYCYPAGPVGLADILPLAAPAPAPEA